MVPGEEEVGREVLVELDRDVGPLSLEEVEFAAMLSHHRSWAALGMVPVDDMLNTGSYHFWGIRVHFWDGFPRPWICILY